MGKLVIAPINIEIPKPEIASLIIPIEGTARLVTHAWSKKAKDMMRDKQTGKPKNKKAPKNPEQDYQDSLYKSTDGWYGFPAVGFKNSAQAACRYTDAIQMVVARGVIFVEADGYTEDGHELVRIYGDEPRMREDMVRIAMGTADIRHRAEFRKWSAVLTVRVNTNVISAPNIFNLFELAGHHVGVGEGRPGAPRTSMDWGRFKIDAEKMAALEKKGKKAA